MKKENVYTHSSDVNADRTVQNKGESLEEVQYRQRKDKNRKRLVAVALAISVIVVGIFMCYAKLFKIEKLKIDGECPYTEEEMMKGMGVSFGDTLYGKSEKDIKQSVKYNLAYIDNVEISRIWPSTLKVKVQKANPTFYISLEESMYVLSQSMRVLSKTDDIEKVELENLIPVQLTGIKSCIEGEFLTSFGDAEQIVRELYDLLKKYEILEDITNIDVMDRFDIRLTYKTKYEVKLGDKVNLDSKIQFMLSIVTEVAKGGSGGIIDVSDDEVKEGTFENYT